MGEADEAQGEIGAELRNPGIRFLAILQKGRSLIPPLLKAEVVPPKVTAFEKFGHRRGILQQFSSPVTISVVTSFSKGKDVHSWFRFYHEVVDDPKVQTLTPYQFRTWVNLLCIAAKHDGVLPDLRSVGYRLRVTESRAMVLVDELVGLDLFEKHEGIYRPHNWNDRQFQSDVSTGRVKRFRERQRNVSETANETDQNRTEQIQNRTEPPNPPAPSALDVGFEEFWKLYPKKKAKGDAQKAWNKLAPQNGMREIIFKAIESQKQSEQWVKDNGQFIPYPATWLNKKCWDDEISLVLGPKTIADVMKAKA